MKSPGKLIATVFTEESLLQTLQSRHVSNPSVDISIDRFLKHPLITARLFHRQVKLHSLVLESIARPLIESSNQMIVATRQGVIAINHPLALHESNVSQQ